MQDFISQEDLSLFTDGSRFNLASIYLREGMQDTIATFDLFVRDLPQTRNFLVFAGLEQVVEYLCDFSFTNRQLGWIREQFQLTDQEMGYFEKLRFSGEVLAMPEGTIFFPNEPIVRITAPIIEAQLIEVFLMNTIYLQTLLASKFARFVHAAQGKLVGIGGSRSYGMDAAMKSVRINEMFGNKSSLALSQFRKGAQSSRGGTYHYFIMSFDREIDAFRSYLKHTSSGHAILIDTYNVNQGINNFIKIAKEAEANGVRVGYLRIDSGDLYELSVVARKMLDDAGLSYVKISAMSDLDEWKVDALEKKNAPIDYYVAATNVLTPLDAPTLELVYKLCETRSGSRIRPIMKMSTGKVSLPGRKQVFRETSNGKYTGDVVGFEEEQRNGERLLVPVVSQGELVRQLPKIDEIRTHYFTEKGKFDPALFDLNTKFDYPVRISDSLQTLANTTREEIKRTHAGGTD